MMIKPHLLAEKIINYSQAYYSGSPIISDEEFDSLVEQLRQISPNHVVLTIPGWGSTDIGKKAKHIGMYPVVGIGSKPKFPDIPKGFDTNVVLTPKLDGLSCVCNFVYGDFQALTRNNGIEGQIITEKMKVILKDIKIDKSVLISVRGEVVTNIKYTDELLEKGIYALRNFAAGVMNRNEVSDDLKYLQFVPYYIRIDTNTEYQQYTDMLYKLAEFGFTRIPYFAIDDLTTEKLQEFFDNCKKEFLIDGLVNRPQLIDTDEGLVSNPDDYTSFESNAIAHKFESDIKEVEVGHVEWNLGSTGKIIPVIVLKDPVELSGAMVQRASGHNAKLIIDHGIGSGAMIRIERANMVIPYYMGKVKDGNPPDIPANCPKCGISLTRNGAHLSCFNIACPNIEMSRIWQYLSLIPSIHGLAGSTFEKFFSTNSITSIKDLIGYFLRNNLVKDEFKSVYSDHYGSLLYEFMVNLKHKSFSSLYYSDFWYILRFNSIGDTNSQKIGRIDPRLSMEELEAQIPTCGVPYTVLKAIKEYEPYWRDLLNFILSHDQSPTLAPLVLLANKEYSMEVCVTGKLSMKRDKYVQLLEARGVKAVDGVGKDLKYLVCNEASSSSKYKKAQSLGIPIITEADFNKMIGL